MPAPSVMVVLSVPAMESSETGISKVIACATGASEAAPRAAAQNRRLLTLIDTPSHPPANGGCALRL
jgi:hypothetical protein